MVIRLTPDIENVLNQEARRQGVTPEQLALDSLGRLFLVPESSEAAEGERSLYDVLARHVGVVDGSTEECEAWRDFGRAHLARVYAENEPDYTEADLKPELNR